MVNMKGVDTSGTVRILLASQHGKSLLLYIDQEDLFGLQLAQKWVLRLLQLVTDRHMESLLWDGRTLFMQLCFLKFQFVILVCCRLRSCDRWVCGSSASYPHIIQPTSSLVFFCSIVVVTIVVALCICVVRVCILCGFWCNKDLVT